MDSFSSSFACARRRGPRRPAGITAWARDLIRHPERYGADQHVRLVVAGLLDDMEAGR